jgi:thiol-disulfide isomerase/thioredoxin
MDFISRRNVLQTLALGSLAFSFGAKAADNSPPAQLPEFQGVQTWLNSPALTLADLKGKVVAIHIWTFACINCQRTLPYIVGLNQKYASQGLLVVGIHTPEFPYERDVNNIKAALKKHEITYPIAVDNSFKMWRAYNNEYWPHLFIADRTGRIRYDHIGEGAYPENERTIRKLLAEG